MYMYMHVRVYVGWGRVENGCGINFLCAVINFYNLFVSVFLVCVGRRWMRQRSSPWPLTNRLTTAPTSSVIGSFRSVRSLSAVYNRWTGLVDWTSGLDYWTDRFSFENARRCSITLPKVPLWLISMLPCNTIFEASSLHC